jgi:SagB-type dehydrogenase family enzyme
MSVKVRKTAILLNLLVLGAGLVACASAPTSLPVPVEAWALTPLPPPIVAGRTSLEEALSQRRSIREFSDTALTPAELAQLLWAAQGTTNRRGFRTAPSAGALYPLETYLVTADGVFHYDPLDHQLRVMSDGDARRALYDSALRQEAVLGAPATFVIAAVYERTEARYGVERSPRYVHLEAGHAAQNLLLQAVALRLGAVPIGAFDDEGIQAALGLPADHEPLYLIPVGHPRNTE